MRFFGSFAWTESRGSLGLAQRFRRSRLALSLLRLLVQSFTSMAASDSYNAYEEEFQQIKESVTSKLSADAVQQRGGASSHLPVPPASDAY